MTTVSDEARPTVGWRGPTQPAARPRRGVAVLARSAVAASLACVVVALMATYLTGTYGSAFNIAVYLVLAALGVGAACYGAWKWRTRLGLVSAFIAASVVFGLVGDIGYNIDVVILDRFVFPAWTDAVYLLSYLAMMVAVTLMVRRREARRDLAALIDATIVAVGFGVVAYAFVVVGVATEDGVSALGRIVGISYPLCDVLVVAVIVRLLLTAGTSSTSAYILVTAMLVLLAGDVGFAVAVVTGHVDDYPRWIDATYLAYYLLVGLAMLRTDAGRLTEVRAEHNERLSRVRLAALGAGTLLAPLTLLAGGVAGDAIKVRGAAIGAAVLFLLAMLRMALLIRAVESQRELLIVLARTDGLTGLANRRTFDYEIERSFSQARNDPRLGPVTLAMLDLDHFKRFNDTYGHTAGDELLRQATTSWSLELMRSAPAAMLARYGGEEFAVVLPGADEDTAVRVVQALLDATPLGQTFSAGVAVCGPDEALGTFVARADELLYAAKAAGRARILGAPVAAAPPADAGLLSGQAG